MGDLQQCYDLFAPERFHRNQDSERPLESKHNFHVRTSDSSNAPLGAWIEYVFVQNKPMMIKASLGAFFSLIFKIFDKLDIIEADNFAPTYFTVFGVSVSLLLVFQANKCYSRFWEARGHLGRVGKNIFDLTRQVVAYPLCTTDKQKATQAHIVFCLQAFFYLMTEQLGGSNDSNLEMLDALTVPERKQVLTYKGSRSLIMCSWITHDINQLRKMNCITEMEAVCMDQTMQNVVQGFFGSTKIKNTGIPIAYTYMIKSMAVIWCWCVPITFIDSFEWGAPLFAFILCFCFFSISAVAEELEDPFGNELNDLPLTTFGNGIKNGIRMIIQEHNFPVHKDKVVKEESMNESKKD